MCGTARALLGTERYDLVSIGPKKYNELYAKVKNVNRLLAWAHARCIENLLAKVPDCPRAVADQFGDPVPGVCATFMNTLLMVLVGSAAVPQIKEACASSTVMILVL